VGSSSKKRGDGGRRQKHSESRSDHEDRYEIGQVTNDRFSSVIRISGGENDVEDEGDLKEGGGFPKQARRKSAVALNQQDYGSDNQQQDVPAQDQYCQPPRNFLLHREHKEGGREQEFVGDRVKVRAERRFLVKRAREVAIDRVGERNKDKNHNSPLVSFVENKNQKKRQDAQTQEGDLIGNRPNAGFHWSNNIADQANWAR